MPPTFPPIMLAPEPTQWSTGFHFPVFPQRSGSNRGLCKTKSSLLALQCTTLQVEAHEGDMGLAATGLPGIHSEWKGRWRSVSVERREADGAKSSH